MPAEVTIIAGPARSGKTTRLLDAYRPRLRELPIGSLLWLSPTKRAAFDLRGRLLSQGLAACFSPGIMTFDQFAQSVLHASSMAVRPMNSAMKRHLVRRLIATAASEKQLSHFAPIADAPGLVDLVDQWISEMKRLEIWPEDFQDACQQRGMSRKDTDLIRLYEQYQKDLTEHQLYDAEGCFWYARQLLRDGQRRPFENLRHVVVDGFSDFTRTQHEILEILAERVESLQVTLVLETDTCREELFAKSLATMAAFQSRHERVKVEHASRLASSFGAVAHVERELFKNPRVVQTSRDTAGLCILAAPSVVGELREIARQIKDLLTRGPVDRPAEPVRPADIMVVFRSLSDMAPLVREVFGEFGIPLAVEANQPLGRSPALSSWVGLLRLEEENWPFRQLLAVLGSNYFDPEWPEWEQGQLRGVVENLLRELQIPEGRDALLAELRRWARPLTAEEQADAERRQRREERRSAAEKVLPVLERLSQAMDALPATATPGGWAQALMELADATGFSRALDWGAEQGRPSPDRMAWQRLCDALSAGDALSAWLNEMPPQLDRADLLEAVLDVLRSESLPHFGDETGCVRVLSAHSARTVDAPYLFFAGLSEKAMPAPDREDRLYSDRECHLLRECGLPMILHDHRSQEEMLLFYEVVTRAGKQLQLSYPAMDEKAQPLLPSPFVSEIERAFDKQASLRREVIDLSPLPEDSHPRGASDFRLRAMHDALHNMPALLAGLCRYSETARPAANLLAGLSVMHERTRRDAFGPHEGILESDAARQRLAERYGDDHRWSASQLEQYASCPYRFFLGQVLGLAPPGEITLATDYAERGWRLHAALTDLHRRINEAHGCATSPTVLDAERFSSEFGEVLQLLFQLSDDDYSVVRSMREIDQRTLADWLASYRQQHASYDCEWQTFDQPLRPAHFEVSFGLPLREGVDPHSTEQPLKLDVGGAVVQLSGRIDRVDMGMACGQMVFNIVDYKSGRSKSPPKEPQIDGTALQLELYAIAAQEVLFAALGATPLEGGYWFIKEKGYKKWLRLHDPIDGGLAPTAEWELRKRQVKEKVAAIAQGIRSAQFPVFSLDEQCTSGCEYRTVCRINQVRSLEKSWPAAATS